MTFKNVFISIFIATAMVVAAFLIHRERPESEVGQPRAEYVRATGKCAECHRKISIGEDAIALERIVIGPRGPVSIDDMKFFHISRCLADYICSTEGENLPSRIP